MTKQEKVGRGALILWLSTKKYSSVFFPVFTERNLDFTNSLKHFTDIPNSSSANICQYLKKRRRWNTDSLIWMNFKTYTYLFASRFLYVYVSPTYFRILKPFQQREWATILDGIISRGSNFVTQTDNKKGVQNNQKLVDVIIEWPLRLSLILVFILHHFNIS